jgi:hypothetical protein
MSAAKLRREDLYSLEKYAEIRQQFRADIIAHKKNRMVRLGANATLHFEDRLTMHYQIQEMLRAERVFEAQGIQDELDAYNPLIPDGANWKATFMVEYSDPEERKVRLAQLIGIEDKVWVKVEGFEPMFAIADEDMERETADKTSSVHFLRFELSESMAGAAKNGAKLAAGISHQHYEIQVDPLAENIRDSLLKDLK